MINARRLISVVVMAAGVALLAGCAGTSGQGSGRAAEPPAYRVGDRWVYQAQDGWFRLIKTWEETHTISAVNADGITERVTLKGPTLDVARSELWLAPGQVKVGALFDSEDTEARHLGLLAIELVRNERPDRHADE